MFVTGSGHLVGRVPFHGGSWCSAHMSSRGPSQLQREIDHAVRFLSQQPGVMRIWVFGSVAKGRRLDWRSDLDLAVEGLPASELASVWSELDQGLGMDVDLIRIEEASSVLRDQVLRHGKLLYEA